jgi:response regulator RpfG family c-di-GMP phosphodiesterase
MLDPVSFFPSPQPLGAAKILLLDDEPNILSVLSSLLSEKYQCTLAANAAEALDYLRSERFDLVLSDILMPRMSGLELLDIIKRAEDSPVVILISGNLNIQSAIEAMRRGAYDYITKPFNLADVEIAVERGLRHLALLRTNRQYERHLQDLVGVRTTELQRSNKKLEVTVERLYVSYRDTLKALAKALEARDAETRGHSERVVAYCLSLGNRLGVSGRDLITLEHGALLHDIGKIGVPDGVLLKRGALSEEEWEHMRRHVTHGTQILSGIDFLAGAREIVHQHHERYDGSGYPMKIGGEQICLGARIFAVADAVDAMTSDRPYRQGRPFEAAADELSKFSGKHFDPQVVQTFLDVPMDTWREMRQMALEPGAIRRNATTGDEVRQSLMSWSGEPLIDGIKGLAN